METRDLQRHSPCRIYCMFHRIRDKSALNTRAYSVICYSSFKGSTGRAVKYVWEIIERCQKRKHPNFDPNKIVPNNSFALKSQGTEEIMS